MPIFHLTEEIIFPNPAFAEENGLLAIGGDLNPNRLIEAYRLGIFPWYSDGDPILWWFTSPRFVIYPEQFRIPKRLARYMKKQPYKVTFDNAFEQVIASCASVKRAHEQGTWITSEMQKAYIRLHALGFAHSVECWQGTTLAGGLYGVALDRVFFGESMFTTISNGSKIALASLVQYLNMKGFKLVDCQMKTDHLLQYGARGISGRQFRDHLKNYIINTSPEGKWKI
jgi:leucyl/phenylalanyl-tRNA---protein transferase